MDLAYEKVSLLQYSIKLRFVQASDLNIALVLEKPDFLNPEIYSFHSRFAGSTSTLDHSGGLTGLSTGAKGSVAVSAVDDDDAYFGTVTSNSRYGSIEGEPGNRYGFFGFLMNSGQKIVCLNSDICKTEQLHNTVAYLRLFEISDVISFLS